MSDLFYLPKDRAQQLRAEAQQRREASLALPQPPARSPLRRLLFLWRRGRLA
ncbi:hypothetical protein [Deinococcus sp. YIM 77859]|uniref:hypothetical protein n=1 Tax=Deinococcus sp. YIM 77859 TaxID=1540221 RepID=UPI000ACCECF9|nr:hypothetical protein [Deinococcus sp. YIM 77859]